VSIGYIGVDVNIGCVVEGTQAARNTPDNKILKHIRNGFILYLVKLICAGLKDFFKIFIC
jgi:hypothetical protein